MASTYQVFDVKFYGALGNATLGVTGSGHDDAAAIVATVAAAVASGKPAVISFSSPGVYRFSEPSGVPYVPSGNIYAGTGTNVAAIQLTGVSNISVHMSPGAILQMDTGYPTATLAGGIAIIGPCSNIVLENINIYWTAPPTIGGGSGGYPGVSFWGQATTGGAYSISGIKILGGMTITNAPMWGLVLQGCSDIQIDSYNIVASSRDGSHFYSCRRMQIGRVTGTGCGDDLVCLDAPYNPNGGTNNDQEFNPLEVGVLFGEWSNGSTSIDSIVADDCDASALKLLGVNGVTVGQVISTLGGAFAVSIFSSAGSPTGGNTYSDPACRGVRIGSIVGVKTGAFTILAAPGSGGFPGASMDTSATAPTANYPGSSADWYSPSYWQHEIHIGSIQAIDVPYAGSGFEDAVGVYVGAGLRVDAISVRSSPGLTVNTTAVDVRFLTVQDITLGQVELIGDGGFSTDNNGFQIQAFSGNSGVTLENSIFNNINIGSLFVSGCSGGDGVSVYLLGLRGGNIGPISALSCGYAGVNIVNCVDMDVPKIQVYNHNRSDTAGIQAIQFDGLRVRTRSVLIKYNKVGSTPNFRSILSVMATTSDCRIDDMMMVTDSVTGAALDLNYWARSNITGVWYNTTSGGAGGVTDGRGTFGFPTLVQTDYGNLGEFTIDTSGNFRLTQVSQGTVFPTSTSTGTIIS